MEAIDLSHLQPKLEAVFEKFPPGNLCDLCADAISNVLHKASYLVEIVTIQNEEAPGRPGMRGQFILVKQPDDTFFALGMNGFHMACRIVRARERFYIDALVYQRFGPQAIDEASYFGLFRYPDSMEITEVQQVR